MDGERQSQELNAAEGRAALKRGRAGQRRGRAAGRAPWGPPWGHPGCGHESQRRAAEPPAPLVGAAAFRPREARGSRCRRGHGGRARAHRVGCGAAWRMEGEPARCPMTSGGGRLTITGSGPLGASGPTMTPALPRSSRPGEPLLSWGALGVGPTHTSSDSRVALRRDSHAQAGGFPPGAETSLSPGARRKRSGRELRKGLEASSKPKTYPSPRARG